MNNDALRVSISCRDNPDCTFDNKDIIVDVIMQNSADHTIGLPLNYFRAKGLHCFLVNNETNKKMVLGISLTPDSLKREFTKMRAGEQVRLSRKISASLIRSMTGKVVNLTANVAIYGLIEMSENEEPVEFTKEAKVTIQGKKNVSERID